MATHIAGVIILLCLLRSTLQSSVGESTEGIFQSCCGYCSVGCELKFNLWHGQCLGMHAVALVHFFITAYFIYFLLIVSLWVSYYSIAPQLMNFGQAWTD